MFKKHVQKDNDSDKAKQILWSAWFGYLVLFWSADFRDLIIYDSCGGF